MVLKHQTIKPKHISFTAAQRSDNYGQIPFLREPIEIVKKKYSKKQIQTGSRFNQSKLARSAYRKPKFIYSNKQSQQKSRSGKSTAQSQNAPVAPVNYEEPNEMPGNLMESIHEI